MKSMRNPIIDNVAPWVDHPVKDLWDRYIPPRRRGWRHGYERDILASIENHLKQRPRR